MKYREKKELEAYLIFMNGTVITDIDDIGPSVYKICFDLDEANELVDSGHYWSKRITVVY